MLEPVEDFSPSKPSAPAPKESLFSRLFGLRGRAAPPPAPPVPEAPVPPAPPTEVTAEPEGAPSVLGPVPRSRRREQVDERVAAGFQDLARLLGTIQEALQSRDGQVQQSLQALPGYLQEVPRIQRAEIECLAQIGRHLEHVGSGTREVLARLDGLPDLLRALTLGQTAQAKFLDDLQARMAGALEVQSQALRDGLERGRAQSEAQLALLQSLASTQQDLFATFQATQNRALHVFHRAQQQTQAQHRETQQVLSRQVQVLVERVHGAQTRVFWLSVGVAALAVAGLVAALWLG